MQFSNTLKAKFTQKKVCGGGRNKCKDDYKKVSPGRRALFRPRLKIKSNKRGHHPWRAFLLHLG